MLQDCWYTTQLQSDNHKIPSNHTQERKDNSSRQTAAWCVHTVMEGDLYRIWCTNDIYSTKYFAQHKYINLLRTLSLTITSGP